MRISNINSLNNTNFKQRYTTPINNSTANKKPKYDISHRFGIIQGARADYDSSSGDYDLRMRGFLPVTKSRELYYPSKGISVIIEKSEGKITKITKTATTTVTQIFDKSAVLKQDKDFSILDNGPLDYVNGEISRLIETPQVRKLVRYDKNLSRKIYIEEKPGERTALIIDTKTGDKITSGKRIYDKHTNKNGDETIENLLTGKIVQETQFRYKSSKIQHQVKYNENSDIPSYIYNYDYRTGQTIEKHMDKDGKVKKLEISRPEGKNKETYIYDEYGNITSHTEAIYGFSLSKVKPVKTKIIYNPKNDDIEKIIDKKGKNTTIKEYSSSEEAGENYPVTIAYIKDGKLNVFEKLQHNGEYVLSRLEFNKLNEVSYESFDEDGNRKSMNYFDKNGNLAVSLDFIQSSGKLDSVTKYKPDSKSYKQYIYSNQSKYPINIVKVDENNRIKKITLNLDDKNNPKNLSRSYFEDSTFDMDWLNKEPDTTSKLPNLPKNRNEALELIDNLEEKTQNTYRTRQRNFRRIG